MKKTKTKIELLINGRPVVIGHQFLEEIVHDIPDIPFNQKIFDILAHSDNPEIRKSLTYKDNLSKKTVQFLLDDENQNVVESILNNSDYAEYVDEDMMQRVIRCNNPKFLQAIATNIEYFKKCNIRNLVKILAKHENPAVRYSLIRWQVGEFLSPKILKKLSKDRDIDVALCAREELNRKFCY